MAAGRCSGINATVGSKRYGLRAGLAVGARRDSEAQEMRTLLVRLSGRLMKRGKGQRGFTEPALLAGLGILMPMLLLLEEKPLDEIRRLARNVLTLEWLAPTSG